MIDHPIDQGRVKTNIPSSVLTPQPFVFQNFFPFGQKFFVEQGVVRGGVGVESRFQITRGVM